MARHMINPPALTIRFIKPFLNGHKIKGMYMNGRKIKGAYMNGKKVFGIVVEH